MTGKRLLICLLAAIALSLAAGLWFSYLWIVEPAAIFPQVLALGLIAILYLYKSIYLVPANKMLVWFFMWTYGGQYVSGTFAKRYPERMQARTVRQGWFDLVFLPWPFYQVRVFPVTAFEVHYEANRSYAKGSLAPLTLRTRAFLRLGDLLDAFVLTFPVLEGKYGYDLTRECTVQYAMDVNEKGEVVWGTYIAPVLGQVISDITSAVVLETLRKAASSFPFSGKDNGITGNRPAFEQKVMYELAVTESPFVQGGLLKDRGQREFNDYLPWLTNRQHLGPTLASFDFNLVDIKPEGKLSDAVTGPEEGLLEAQRLAAIGEGEGNRLKAIAERTGMTAKEVRQLESLDRAESLNVVAAGDSPLQELGTMLWGLQPKVRKKPPEK